jgi:hypothetical protein
VSGIVKSVQLVIKSGGNMRKTIKKSPTKREQKQVVVQPSANQRRLLELLITGIEAEEPVGVLAGESFRFSS